MSKKSKVGKSEKHHIVIIELDASMPRRDPKKSHLYIGVTPSEAEARLTQLKNGSGPKYARGHYLSVFEREPYSKPARDQGIAKRRLNEIIEKYSRLGHAVNNQVNEWHVYVINLKQDHLKVKPKLGHVYVGSTSKSITQRVEEHENRLTSKKGRRLNSKYVTKHFQGLNKALSLRQKFFTRMSAVNREESYAEELCKKGYLVRAGQFTPNQQTCISKRKTKNQ